MKELQTILDFYVPIVAKLPSLRDDEQFMQEEVKAVGSNGISDVVTKADVYVQAELQKKVEQHFPQWQFWGEEENASNKEIDTSKNHLFITDPIEGTNNFKNHKDDCWGSVVAVVDLETNEPIIGIVAQPTQQRLFYAVKGEGAHVAYFDGEGKITKDEKLKNEADQNYFTYNNSPHFSKELVEQIDRFLTLGFVLPDTPDADELELSRKAVEIKREDEVVTFVDVECGALEPFLYQGGIMFKTSVEMAAVFVILRELGGVVTTAEEGEWTIDINTLIFARNQQDYDFLKSIYDQTVQEPAQGSTD